MPEVRAAAYDLPGMRRAGAAVAASGRSIGPAGTPMSWSERTRSAAMATESQMMQAARARQLDRARMRGMAADATRNVASAILTVAGVGFLVAALAALPDTSATTAPVTTTPSMTTSAAAAAVGLVFLFGGFLAGRPISMVKAAKMSAKAHKKATKRAKKYNAKLEKNVAKANKLLSKSG
jgi:hypothetical protein